MAPAAVDRVAPESVVQVRNLISLAAVCGLLVLAVIAVFGQTVRHDFVNFDDDDYVYENRHVNRGLTGEAVAWAITAYHSDNWHPLTWLSHMLDCQLYGLAPGGHHLTNVILHAAAAVLLLLALRRMTGALWPSAWVAAVFAIHPLRVESVAWVAERKDVLSGLCFMSTLWFYARYVERPASRGRYLLVVASFALGLTAKPMLVTLPFVLLLLDYWPLGRISPFRGGRKEGEANPPRPTGGPDSLSIWAAQRQEALKTPLMPGGTPIAELSVPPVRLVVEKIPLFVLAAASCAITLAAQHDAMRRLEPLSFPWRVANAAVAYVAYLGQMVCPVGLAVLYPRPEGPPPVMHVVAAVAVLLAISTAVFMARRKCPCLVVGWLWYLGTLVPVIGLVQVGAQAMADRYTYLTQIGLYVAIAWGAMLLAGSWPCRRWGFAVISALIVAGLMVCAWQQTRYWRDSETLWTRELACTRENPLAHSNFGVALAGHGRFDEAIAHFRKALELKPDYAIAHNDLGMVLSGRRQVDEAIGHYQKALEIEPDYVEAHNNLGNVLADRGQVDEAIAHYRRALEIRPGDGDVQANLGYALARRGKIDEAIVHFRKALKIKPDDAETRYNFGNTLARCGLIDEAIGQYRKAVEIKPDYADAHCNLGNALAGRGQIDEAIGQYRKVLELKPDDMETHYNLGGALAGRGQVDEAMEHYQKALGLATARNNKALAEAIRVRIKPHSR